MQNVLIPTCPSWCDGSCGDPVPLDVVTAPRYAAVAGTRHRTHQLDLEVAGTVVTLVRSDHDEHAGAVEVRVVGGDVDLAVVLRALADRLV